MIFAHDTEAALIAAAALVNSAGPPDTLNTREQLDAFYAEHRYSGQCSHDAAELEAVRSLRPTIRRLLTSERDETAAQTNQLLAAARALPQLVRHDDLDWHVHAVPAGCAPATRIAVDIAMAMTDVIRADEHSRFGLCANEGCTGVLVDLSRNRSRRFCSTACSNRNAVAAYRTRRAHGRIPR